MFPKWTLLAVLLPLSFYFSRSFAVFWGFSVPECIEIILGSKELGRLKGIEFFGEVHTDYSSSSSIYIIFYDNPYFLARADCILILRSCSSVLLEFFCSTWFNFSCSIEVDYPWV